MPWISAAEDDALAQRRQRGAGSEGEIPVGLAGLRDGAEFERDAAEDERKQHHDHRQIERRHDDGIGARERDPQSAAAEHQPGLVAVPERRDRGDHLVALFFVATERKQDADAEIETVEDDVERDRETDHAGPDQRQIPLHAGVPSVAPAGIKSRVPSPRVRRRGRPTSAATADPARAVPPRGPAARARSDG